MKIFLASPRGFCSGVHRAFNLVQEQVDLHHGNGNDIFILHEVVHNEFAVKRFQQQGVHTIDEPEQAPSGSILIYSAHGVSADIERRANAANLQIIDATCPLVKLVHRKAAELSANGYHILLFGKARHREVEGILGRINGPKTLLSDIRQAQNFQAETGVKYASLSQTTFNNSELKKMLDILQQKIPDLLNLGNVCSATAERQEAMKCLASHCDTILVIGSHNSSNTKRLLETALQTGAKAYLISDASALRDDMLKDAVQVGIASGASAPEDLVQGVLNKLLAWGGIFAGEIKS